MIPQEVTQLVANARQNHQKVILVTGVFDVLHPKHAEFLHNAKALGGVLLVGIESDVRVKQLKGSARPFFSESQRLAHLRDLEIADMIFILSENFGEASEREALIKEIQPDYLAVSSNSPNQEKKQALVEKYGGQLKIVTQYDSRFSSTQLIDQLRADQQNAEGGK